MGWSITPNDLASIDSNGHVTFSRHTEDIVYTVTYSDANFTCSKAITVYHCRPDCLCENVDLQAEATAGGNSIPAVGYDTDTVIGTFNDTTCLSSLTVSSNQTWVKGVRISGHNIYAQVDENESIISARTATITITGKDGENVDCPDDFIITQEMSASTCSCDDLNVVATTIRIPQTSASSLVIGSYSAGTCIENIGVNSLEAWAVPSINNGQIIVDVESNPKVNKRTTIITVTGNVGTETCRKGFTLTQEKSSCVPGVSCDLIPLVIECEGTGSDPHVKCKFSAYTTSIIDGVCHKEITISADTKNIWMPSYPIGCNTTGEGREYGIYVYLNGTSLYGYPAQSPAAGTYVGYYTFTQEACGGCTPGTDNYGTDIHSLSIGPEAGRTNSDTNRCGFDLTDTALTISHYSGDSFINWTIVSSTQINYVTTSANPSLSTTRNETLLFTYNGTQRPTDCCVSEFCSSWLVNIIQDADVCGCQKVHVDADITIQGQEGSTGTINWNTPCTIPDPSGFWCDSSGNPASVPEWLTIDSDDWNSTGGFVTFKATEDNWSQVSRTAYYKFDLKMPYAPGQNDCSHIRKITQLPRTN